MLATFQHGRAFKTLPSAEEAGLQRPGVVGFPLREPSRAGKATETGGRLTNAWRGGDAGRRLPAGTHILSVLMKMS